MRILLTLITAALMSSCGQNDKESLLEKYVVQTEVKIKSGKTNDVLELFKSTNPKLVSEEPDWIRASFSSIEDKNLVIVRAEWKNKKSYLKFSESEKFKNTMDGFSQYFRGKPKVTISKVIFEM